MKTNLLFTAAFCAGLLLISCQEEEPQVVNGPKTISATESLKDGLALEVVDLLNQANLRTEIIGTLQQNKVGVTVEEIVTITNKNGKNSRAASNLRQIASTSTTVFEKGKEAPQNIIVPELFLYEPTNAVKSKELLVAYAPDGEEDSWQKIKAYTLDKQVVYLDPFKTPNVNVVVVETSGFEALKVEVQYMNEMLKKAGLQHSKIKKSGKGSRAGLETTILDKIRLNDDEEPWIKGAAEIYAVTSGIRNTNNAAEVNVIPMYYLDHDGDTYYPNQVMLFWDDYRYQAANIQLFEKDSNYNYKDLVGILVDGIASIVGNISGQPWVSALGQIASAVIQALPDNWYTDDDDYVDSFYTVEKTKTYTNHYGARGNARVNMRPYFIPAN